MSWSIVNDIAKFINESESFLIEHEAHNNMLLQFLARAVQNRTGGAAGFQNNQGSFAFFSDGSLLLNKAPSASSDGLATAVAQFLVTKTLNMVMGPEDLARTFARDWLQQNRQVRIEKEFPMTLQKLDRVNPIEKPSGQFRRAWLEEVELLSTWFEEFWKETGVPGPPGLTSKEIALQMINTKQLFVWGNNRPASMVGVSGSTPKGIRVHSVYTPVDKRGKGLAKATVAALSELQLSQGKEFLVLYNDALKPENAELYNKIGFKPIDSHFSYFFSSK